MVRHIAVRDIALIALVALSPVLLTACGEEVDAGPDVSELSRTALETSEPVIEEVAIATEPAPIPVIEQAAPEAPPIETFEVRVRSGENLVLLAAWAGTSVESIVDVNALDAREPLYPGQTLLMPLSEEGGPEILAHARDTALDGKLERYVSRRGGLAGVSEHRVRTGETAWAIARDQAGIPTWVLSAYNRDTNLDRLRIGDILVVPVYVDTIPSPTDVAEATGTDDSPGVEALAAEGLEPVEPVVGDEDELSLLDTLAPRIGPAE